MPRQSRDLAENTKASGRGSSIWLLFGSDRGANRSSGHTAQGKNIGPKLGDGDSAAKDSPSDEHVSHRRSLQEGQEVDPSCYDARIWEAEWRALAAGESVRELEDAVRERPESKYGLQAELKDLKFQVDKDQALRLPPPFESVDQAEQALREGVIRPTTFLENDDTEHQVIFFDTEPAGSSGFMNCAIHSLPLTNEGLFEVGRYPALSLTSQTRHWQWFLHRRLATSDQVAAVTKDHGLSDQQVVDAFFGCPMVGERSSEKDEHRVWSTN